MNAIAASRTERNPVAAQGVTRRASIEDLNWPTPGAPSDKKPARRVDMWVPGREIDWLGTGGVDCRSAVAMLQ